MICFLHFWFIEASKSVEFFLVFFQKLVDSLNSGLVNGIIIVSEIDGIVDLLIAFLLAFIHLYSR